MPPRFRAVLLGLALGIAPIPTPAAPLRVGIDLDGSPMTFVDAKGVPQGFAVEIMDGIAREMGFEVVYVAKPWPEMLEDFRAGRTDALANITYTAERAGFIGFSDPHIVMGAAIFVRTDGPRVTSAMDLRELRVAVKPGGAPEAYLKAHGWADHLVPAGTLRDALRAVAEGRADATFDARIVGTKDIREEHLTNIEPAEVELLDYAQRLHIGLRPDDTTRIGQMNEGLARLRASGAYDRIYDRWIGPLEPGRLRFKDVRPYLPVAGLVAIAILGALVWQRRMLGRLARQAEALRTSEERLKLVLEGSEAGFWDWDLATNRIERSERWAAMLGYSVSEIAALPEGALELVHPDDRAYLENAFAARRAGALNRQDFEYRMRAKTGGWRWILDRGKVVARAADGTPRRLAGTHTDITQVKEAEAEREALRLKMIESQKLESLGVLAGGIAHDFNNLLTVILANTTFVRTLGASPAENEERLAHIETAARRAADLCRQMLAYAGKGQFIVGRLDVSGLVRETTQLLQVSISKKARLEVTLAPDLPAVEADATQIQQVVMNLVINASDALGDQPGEIRLATFRGAPVAPADGVMHVFTPAGSDCVCLEVGDTGQGMDPRMLARIFEPFFTTKFAGRGLGLAAVLGIVRSSRGTLIVRSAPGHGTTFQLYLPVAKGPAPAHQPAGPASVPTVAGQGTILIADDEPTVLQTAAKMLERQGYATVLAADGNEAVAKFSAEPDRFAAVLLDLTMPGLSGAEVLREIRRLRPGVRVLIMSGFSEQDVLAQLQGQGAIAILHKPFAMEALLARMAEVIRS
ncbi:MAG TPA: transporter substrate-binding domain-containing protein [Lacunisphaera sp.]|nr:transporter substrate-binding domain-containing protein [Lacunisphaera sp.]